MTEVFDSIAIPSRSVKPRDAGITMVLDKHLGTEALSDLMQLTSDYIDIVKFGWGTSRLLTKSVVREKVDIFKRYHVSVCPGGTLFEIAYTQGKTREFFNEAKNLGFTHVEISDGTIWIPHIEKTDAIKQALDCGLGVLSEIGKKHPKDAVLTIDSMIAKALTDLESGAWKIVIEARESGSLGIFDDAGKVIPQSVDALVSRVGLQNIIFEAPRISQQLWMIRNLGRDVNLGNIKPSDCLNLETLRVGLRSDTMFSFMEVGHD